MRSFATALALTATSLMLAGCATVTPVSIEDVRAGNLGSTQETAIKVSSVRQEYELVQSLGLEIESQGLSMSAGKAYDVLTVKSPQTGEVRKLWFDISSFFGRY